MTKHGDSLYLQVLIGIALGIILGLAHPQWGAEMKILGDAFIALLKMLVGPIVFATVVLGITRTGNMKKVGKVGIKSLIYFETVSNIALVIGLLAVNLLQPGKGFNADVATLDASPIADFAQKGQNASMMDFIKGIIPKTFFDAFTGAGDILQVLFVALLFGYALNKLGDQGQRVRGLLEEGSQIFFTMIRFLMRFAPVGAFGAMAFTIGKYGSQSFGPLLALMGTFYLTCLIFIFGALGLVAHYCGFSLWKFLRYIREELFTVLGTSSSESVLVPLMQKLEKLGCSNSVVGLVVPTGYSFNLDGTNIYITVAAVFIAQALNIDLTLGEQLKILLVAVITSQGASGVTGAGFITLAATLSVVPSIPITGLALIFGIDRFMSEARSLTNTIGNGVAAIVISRWEGELDRKQLEKELA